MSLPYPSMVFVPLDILTAEEMNQIVGNIESLAAGTGLDSGAITSDKIDWTTLAQTISLAANVTKTLTLDPNCIYLILYTVGSQSGMWLVQARSNLLYVNPMTTPSGVSTPTYSTSVLDLSITAGTSAVRVVATKMMANVSW